MKTRFREISFPDTFKYSSDSEHMPLEFYEEVFPISKSIDLLLGYFSSNAFKVLSQSFAEFVYNGGHMRIITNHVYSLKDKENLIENTNLQNEDRVIEIFEDIENLANELSDYGQHFFDCLKYLINKGRLTITPVKFNGVDLAHSKKMILFDGYDYLSTDGSINFTLSALTKNGESFEVNAPWNGDIFRKRTEQEKNNFDLIVSGKHPNYQYIKPSQIEVAIQKVGNSKEIDELLQDSINIGDKLTAEKFKKLKDKKAKRFAYILKDHRGLPRFPYSTGPRNYQNEAYLNWLKNGKAGVFAMATGTGKTITSLNCLLKEYESNQCYHAIILVPSIALLNQWEKEVAQFNFDKVLLVGGGNKWEQLFANYTSNFQWDIKDDLVIIATYGSFITDRFQKYFSKIQKDFLLIADEAHNMGSSSIREKLKGITSERKIGLSATPKRIYDPEGTLALDQFFNDTPPYTYSFSMKRALEEGFLNEYKYYPHIVELEDEEFEEYIKISNKLLKFFDFEKGTFKKDPIVEILLLKRKNLIHKANAKLKVFEEILLQLHQKDKLHYAFGYVPEGYNKGKEDSRLIEEYLKAAARAVPDIKTNSYTTQDDKLSDIIRGFSEGKIDLLLAMKMLDEGVDIPRAEIGIFCSSTGNPRQFIQRRGRLLRKHPDKAFAIIHDMVVIPKMSWYSKDTFRMESNMVKNELRRVGYFASLAMNYYDSKENLESVCTKYNLELDQIIEEL